MASNPVEEDSRRLILGLTAPEIADRFRRGTQRAVDEHLAAGHVVYGSDEHGKVHAFRLDGRSVPIVPSNPSSPANPDSRAS